MDKEKIKKYNALVEYAKIHLQDIIPYDDPNYDEKLQQVAESYATYELYGDNDLDKICKWHDDLLEQGLIRN